MAKIPSSAELLAVQKTPTVVHFEITSADSSQTFSIPVKAGTFVHQVATFVQVAFTAATGTPSLKIGDSSNLNGYLDTSDVVVGTIDTATTSSFAGGEAFAYGKYYAVNDSIKLTFVAATTGGTAGTVKGFVVLSNVKLDGIAE